MFLKILVSSFIAFSLLVWSKHIEANDATPIVKIAPKYPPIAARNGQEGYVAMSFTINEIGGVEDILVTESEPEGIFDKEAVRALKKWKYKPNIVDGKGTKQKGMTIRLDFELN